MMKKPCISCTRVTDPENCEDKRCQAWQRWFTDAWDQLRRQPRLSMETHPKKPEGMVIGGVRYALPHRVKGYLQKDPCDGCLCPRDLCTLPCRVKRDWDQAWKLLH
jgi:hypothetical protein